MTAFWMSSGAGFSAVLRNNERVGAGNITENHESLTEAGRMAELRVVNAERARAYRSRQRRGVVWVWIEIEPRALAGLERLALLAKDERELDAVPEAVARFVHAAAPLAAVGDALWSEVEE